jgi:hypothetical protein
MDGPSCLVQLSSTTTPPYIAASPLTIAPDPTVLQEPFHTHHIIHALRPFTPAETSHVAESFDLLLPPPPFGINHDVH